MATASILYELLSEMEKFTNAKHKTPTHLYLTSKTLERIIKSGPFPGPVGSKVLGMQLILCSEMPDSREWFVTA